MERDFARADTFIRQLGALVCTGVCLFGALCVLAVAAATRETVLINPIAAAQQRELLPAVYAVLSVGAVPAAVVGFLLSAAIARAGRSTATMLVVAISVVAVLMGAAVGLTLSILDLFLVHPLNLWSDVLPFVVAYSMFAVALYGPAAWPIALAAAAISASLLRRLVRRSAFA
jgi:hypothetical protein